ncbi:MAG: hypothetical protein ABI867_41230 [Kofleriaceae bacterium]
MRRAIAIFFVLAACGGANGAGDDDDSDAMPTPDAPGACETGILPFPLSPVAGAGNSVRLQAEVRNAPGVQTFQWNLMNGATPYPFEIGSLDGDVITFAIPTQITLDAFMRVSVPGGLFCPEAHQQIVVRVPNAMQEDFRIRVVAPAGTNRPPIDEHVLVTSGLESPLDDVQLDGGIDFHGTVTNGASPIPAYLKFMPDTGKEAVVEAFADSAGAFDALLRNEPHDVLVIPVSSTLAPRIVRWMPGQTQLAVDAGTAISGTVRDGANAAIAGAKVQLTVNGVLSTLDTTDAAGAFTVRAVPIAGATVVIDVVPPPSTGLPRLLASSTFNLAQQPIAVKLNTVTIRDLAGSVVRRAGVAVPNAQVSIVGAVTGVGTVTTAAGSPVTSDGEVRVTVTANASGVLPALKVPAKALQQVVEVTAGEFSTAAIDLTAGVPASINAPAMGTVATVIRDPSNTPIAGAVLDAIPLGALALANAPVIHVVSGAGGTISTSFAVGGQYDVRFSDPGHRGGRRKVPGVSTIASLDGTTHSLEPRTLVKALVKGAAPIANASVQLLCGSCTGLERSRPIAEGLTGIDGKFSLAVPEP